MDDLIKIEDKNGEPRVSSKIISDELGVEHASTVKMIRKFDAKLEKYGRVGFEIEPIETPGGTQDIPIFYLNERQSTFLVTLSKNSEKAVDLKQKLTDSYHFYKSQHSQPNLPKTFSESLRMLADEVEKTTILENKIQEDKPLVEFASNIQESNDAISIGEFAKILNKNGYKTGQNRLFKNLRELKLVFIRDRKNVPYQTAIEAGWLKHDEYNKKVVLTATKEVIDKLCTKISITGKGQVYIEKKLREL